MTRAELLTAFVEEGSVRIGEGVWNVLTLMGVDLRRLVCTPEDPWALSSQPEVESWVDRHVAFDDSGHLIRVTLNMR